MSLPTTYEKPFPHVAMDDWYAKLRQNHQTNDTRRNDSLKLRFEAAKLRNETDVRTRWNNHWNNNKLADRVTELDRWKATFELALSRINNELSELKNEKLMTERHLDALGIPLAVVQECINVRDSRRRTELTGDEVEKELKKELCLLEKCKQLLTERCHAAWEKINELEEVQFKLDRELSNKYEALGIDQEQLGLNEKSAVVTLKVDPLRIDERSVPHECWLEHCQTLKKLAENELAHSMKCRESLFAVREQVKNDMAAQRDHLEFTLRKRIYDTQKVRNEIQWQQLKMREEMNKLLKEIRNIQDALQRKTNPLKLVETRLENRFHRPCVDLESDAAEEGLKDETLQLRKSRDELAAKLNDAKVTFNALENQQYLIDRDLDDKNHTMTMDVRCLDLRSRLRMDEFSEFESKTDRNMELVKMETEMAEM